MDDSERIDAIREASHCLWEALTRIRKDDAEENDADFSRSCYYELRDLLTQYYESGSLHMDDTEVWFAWKVLEAYEDISLRLLVN